MFATLAVAGLFIACSKKSSSSTSSGGGGAESISSNATPRLALSGTSSVTSGSCSTVLTVTSQNSAGATTAVTTNTTVNLVSTGVGGYFYSNNSCSSQVTQVTISSGSGTAAFYYKKVTADSVTITVSATGFTSGTASITVASNGSESSIAVTLNDALKTFSTNCRCDYLSPGDSLFSTVMPYCQASDGSEFNLSFGAILLNRTYNCASGGGGSLMYTLAGVPYFPGGGGEDPPVCSIYLSSASGVAVGSVLSGIFSGTLTQSGRNPFVATHGSFTCVVTSVSP